MARAASRQRPDRSPPANDRSVRRTPGPCPRSRRPAPATQVVPARVALPRARYDIVIDEFSDLGQLLVVVPTYQERDNLDAIARRLFTAVPGAHLLVVDDDSPDGTGEVADALAAADPRVHVLHRLTKSGLGPAYVAGFGWALERSYDVVVEMDADGSHHPEQLPTLLAALRGSDLVLGSRWIAGGAVQHWPWTRRALSRGANVYTRLLLRLPLADATGGFRAYRRRVLEGLPLTDVASHGYCFQVDLAWRAWRGGFTVLEVPITFTDRELGKSKMSRVIVIEALWRVTWWGVLDRARSLRRSRGRGG